MGTNNISKIYIYDPMGIKKGSNTISYFVIAFYLYEKFLIGEGKEEKEEQEREKGKENSAKLWG